MVFSSLTFLYLFLIFIFILKHIFPVTSFIFFFKFIKPT